MSGAGAEHPEIYKPEFWERVGLVNTEELADQLGIDKRILSQARKECGYSPRQVRKRHLAQGLKRCGGYMVRKRPSPNACYRVLLLSEFHRSRYYADGHLTRCKKCWLKYSKAWWRRRQSA